jgi:hypothetical protein
VEGFAVKSEKKKVRAKFPPDRRPLILSYDESNFLMFYVSEEIEKLRTLRPGTAYGKNKLKMLCTLLRKFYQI